MGKLTQRPLADRDILHDAEAESEDQDIRGNQPQCAFDTDLDSIDCHPHPEVPEVPINVRMVAVEPCGDASLQSLCLQGLVGLDQ